MMEIDILLTPIEVTRERVEGRAVVVIDVFRATSCICAAFNSGAAELIPLTSIDDCLDMRSRLTDRRVLLGGERKTRKIEGFDLDNSPLSYCDADIKGATIIMSTTNGTRTLNAAEDAFAHTIGIASINNAAAAADFLASQGRDVAIICAGRHNRYTMEDAMCAGYIASLINERHTCHLSDIAWIMADSYTRHKGDMRAALRNSVHYNQIMDGGLADDVAYCLQTDILTNVPILSHGTIVNG